MIDSVFTQQQRREDRIQLMLGEDLDIGLYAEDAYAAYVVHVATALQLVPDFSNARGATVDAIFTGPFWTESAFQEAASALRRENVAPLVLPPCGDESSEGGTSLWERLAKMSLDDTTLKATVAVAVLHAWIEKLNGARKVQVTEQVRVVPRPNAGFGGCAATDDTCNPVPETEEETKEKAHRATHRRVLGNLDFLLHLSTSSVLLAESNTASQDSLNMERYGAPSGLTGAAADGSEEVRDTLEQRDDVAVARNAVDTVIKFAKLAEEHAGEVATVHVDASQGVEYLQFNS